MYLVRDGVLGGINGALYERWNPILPMHSLEISQSMKLTRFFEIKRNVKLCNNDAAKSRDQESYDPAYKFDLPYKALVANTNTISAKDYDNQVISDSSWPHCGYVEAGYGICGRLSRKMKFKKGG